MSRVTALTVYVIHDDGRLQRADSWCTSSSLVGSTPKEDCFSQELQEGLSFNKALPERSDRLLARICMPLRVATFNELRGTTTV